MTEAAIRTQIHTIIEAVDEIGVAYDYERWANTWDEFIELFRVQVGQQNVIRGWEVGYTGFGLSEQLTEWAQFGSIVVRDHRFRIRGYHQVQDAEASEKEAATLALAVCDAIDTNTALQEGYFFVSQATMEMEHRQFASVLCHYMEIAVNVQEQNA